MTGKKKRDREGAEKVTGKEKKEKKKEKEKKERWRFWRNKEEEKKGRQVSR